MSEMRILIFGASGVLGRAVVPHLAGHELAGTTRSEKKLPLLGDLGLQSFVCNAYDREATFACARAFAPEIVVNLLTDLAEGPGPANSRIRREACPNVTAAARAAGARRLVVESIAFATTAESDAAVASMERDALESGLAALIIRFGRLWGPDTWSPETPPKAPAAQVHSAGRRASALILGSATGVEIVTDP